MVKRKRCVGLGARELEHEREDRSSFNSRACIFLIALRNRRIQKEKMIPFGYEREGVEISTLVRCEVRYGWQAWLGSA